MSIGKLDGSMAGLPPPGSDTANYETLVLQGFGLLSLCPFPF